MNETIVTYRWELTSDHQRLKEFLKKRIEKRKNKNTIKSKQKFKPNENQRWT